MKMIDDGRQCTAAVNNLMEAMQAQRYMPPIDGETQYFHQAYFFGHYDSRGGTSLLIGPTKDTLAVMGYNMLLGWDVFDNIGMEDFMSEGCMSLAIVGKQLTEDMHGKDILAGYANNPQYVAFRLEGRYKMLDGNKSQWAEKNYFVLVQIPEDFDFSADYDEEFKNFAPKVLPDQYGNEYRPVFYEMGEDAYGLALFFINDKHIKLALKQTFKLK